MTTKIKDYAEILRKGLPTGTNVPADKSDAFWEADRQYITGLQQRFTELLKIPAVQKLFEIDVGNKKLYTPDIRITGHLNNDDALFILELGKIIPKLEDLENMKTSVGRGNPNPTRALPDDQKKQIAEIRALSPTLNDVREFRFSSNSDYQVIKNTNAVLGLKMLMQDGGMTVSSFTGIDAPVDFNDKTNDWKFALALTKQRLILQGLCNSLLIREMTGMPPVAMTGEDTPEMRTAMDKMLAHPQAKERLADAGMSYDSIKQFWSMYKKLDSKQVAELDTALNTGTQRYINLYAYAANMQKVNEVTGGLPDIKAVVADAAYNPAQQAELAKINKFVSGYFGNDSETGQPNVKKIRSLIDEAAPSAADSLRWGDPVAAMKPEDINFLIDYRGHFLEMEEFKNGAIERSKIPASPARTPEQEKLFVLQGFVLMNAGSIYDAADMPRFYDTWLSDVKLDGKTDDLVMSRNLSLIGLKARQIAMENISDPEFFKHYSQNAGFTFGELLSMDKGQTDANMLKLIRAVASYEKLESLDMVTKAAAGAVRGVAGLSDKQVNELRDNPVRIMNDGVTALADIFLPKQYKPGDNTAITNKMATTYGMCIDEMHKQISQPRNADFLAGLINQAKIPPAAVKFITTLAEDIHAAKIKPDLLAIKKLINENITTINAALPDKQKLPDRIAANEDPNDPAFKSALAVLANTDLEKLGLTPEKKEMLVGLLNRSEAFFKPNDEANLREHFLKFPPYGQGADYLLLSGQPDDPTSAVANLIRTLENAPSDLKITLPQSMKQLALASAAMGEMNKAVATFTTFQKTQMDKEMMDYEITRAKDHILAVKRFIKDRFTELNSILPEKDSLREAPAMTASLDDVNFIKALSAIKSIDWGKQRLIISTDVENLAGHLVALDRLKFLIEARKLAVSLGVTDLKFGDKPQETIDNIPLLLLKQSVASMAGNKVFTGIPAFNPSVDLLKADEPGFIAAFAKADSNLLSRVPKDVYASCHLTGEDILRRINDRVQKMSSKERLHFDRVSVATELKYASELVTFKPGDFKGFPEGSFTLDPATGKALGMNEDVLTRGNIETLQNLLTQKIGALAPAQQAELQGAQMAIRMESAGKAKKLSPIEQIRFELPQIIDAIGSTSPQLRLALLVDSVNDPVFAEKLVSIPAGMTKEQYIQDLATGLHTIATVKEIMESYPALGETINNSVTELKNKEAATLTSAAANISPGALSGNFGDKADVSVLPPLSANAGELIAGMQIAGEAITPRGATNPAANTDTGTFSPRNRAAVKNPGNTA